MAKNLGIGVIGLQSPKQGDKGMLLGRGTGVAGFALGIETSLIANANRVGVVATGMGSNQILATIITTIAGTLCVQSCAPSWF